MRQVAIGLILLVGCASTQPPRAMLFDYDRRPEERELPPAPERASNTSTFAVEAGQPAEFAAVCLNEKLANEYAQYKIRYGRLRQNYEADRIVWGAHREAYETKIHLADDRIDELQPSWWEEHDGQVMGAIGLVLGACFAVTLTYALEGATE